MAAAVYNHQRGEFKTFWSPSADIQAGRAIPQVFHFLSHRDSPILLLVVVGEKGRHLLTSLTTIVGWRRGRTLNKTFNLLTIYVKVSDLL